MRGVSAIIAIILILMIVIALASMMYMFFVGIFTTSTSAATQSLNTSTKSFMANMKIESMTLNNIYVRNIGQSDLAGFSVYVNDEPVDFNLTPPVIRPGDLGTIKITDFVKENDEIKITNAQGIISSKKAPDPCDEAILCLNFDEGQGKITIDNSGNGNNGIFSGEAYNDGTLLPVSSEPIRVDGKFGKALSFDGINDYIGITDRPGLDGMSELTLECWMKFNEFVGGEVYPCIGKIQYGDTYELVVHGTKQMEFCVANATTWGCISTGVQSYFTPNVWYHIAATYKPNGEGRIYVNGGYLLYFFAIIPAFGGGNIYGNLRDTSNPVQIGKGFDALRIMNGTIDEVRIYNRSLSQQDIQADMESSMPLSRTIASYGFEETGNYVNDTHIWVQGKSGSALSFDGFDDYVEIPDNVNLKSSSFTIEFLAYPKGSGAYNRWMGKNNYTVPREGWVILWTGTTADKVYLVIFNSASEVPSQLINISLNEWAHLAFTVDDNTKQITAFKNGQQYSTPISYTSWDPSNVSFSIGKADGTYFNGTIDELRIYNKAIY